MYESPNGETGNVMLTSKDVLPPDPPERDPTDDVQRDPTPQEELCARVERLVVIDGLLIDGPASIDQRCEPVHLDGNLDSSSWL